MTTRSCLAVGLALVAACAPVYEPATLSTLAPQSRLTLADSSQIAVRQPEVRGDSLYSANQAPVAVADITRVERRKDDSSQNLLFILAGAAVGIGIAAAQASGGGN